MAEVGYRPAGHHLFRDCRTAMATTPANANDFAARPGSCNQAEHDAMFAEKAPRFYTAGRPTAR